MARSVPVFCKCVGPLTADSLYDYVGSSLSGTTTIRIPASAISFSLPPMAVRGTRSRSLGSRQFFPLAGVIVAMYAIQTKNLCLRQVHTHGLQNVSHTPIIDRSLSQQHHGCGSVGPDRKVQ